MSQNKSDSDAGNNFGGGTGTTRDSSSTGLSTGGSSSSGGGAGTSGSVTFPYSGGEGGTGTATAPATGITAKAKEYGQTVADAASQAKDYLSDKASVVGDKFQDLRNKDYAVMAEDAKDYARQNPGQALLVAAAAGFVIGLLVRGGRK